MSSAFKATLTATTPPTSQQNTPLIQVKVPPTPAQAVAKERAVLTRLKQDKKCEYVKNNPQEVGEVIYIAPFDDSSPEVNRRARQKRLKAKVDRSAIPLDFGTTSSTNSQALSSTSSGIVHPRKAARRILNERFKLSVSPALSLKHQHGTRQLSGKFQFEKLGSKFVDIAGLQPYSRSQNGPVVLSDAFLAAEKDEHKVRIIYECNDYCGCDQRCTNRVVQNGRTIPLQIFDTDNRGFGVKPMRDIARGQFIDLYLGEVLTVGEVERREDAVEENAMSYFMSLDVFTTDENSTLLVDGANFGSVMRFVNHSCEPNAKTVPVVLSKDTKHLYHVAFFAIKDIPKGIEITIDYDPDLQNLEEEPLDSLVVQCRCGSVNCRKRLWAPGKAKRARKR
ncbi:hypothetical protein LTS08_007976 [Lithohypha guttulata]|nr:hypothetical protein LTS08_007976 [Lithohypha guttulata]